MATLAEATRGAGHDAVAVAYLEGGPLRASLERAGVRTEVIRAHGAADDAQLPARLAGWLAQQRVDLVHTHHLGPAVAGRAVAGLLGVPLVHTEHGIGLGNGYRRRWLGAGLDGLAHVAAVTPRVARVRWAQLGCESRVIELGVAAPRPLLPGERPRRRSSLGLPARGFVVACADRALDEAQQALLVAAATATEGLHLLLLGEGPGPTPLTALAERAGIGQRVHVAGSPADGDPWWGLADVALSLGGGVGQPLGLLEAMAEGVPVVAAWAEGLERAQAQGAALVVAPEVGAVGAALSSLAGDAGLRTRLAVGAQRFVAIHHSVEQMTARYLDLYASVLTGAAPLRRAA